MERFVFKFLCVFYLAMVVNCRYINKNSKITGDIFGIGRNEIEHKNKHKREEKSTTEIDKILANINAKINNLKEEYSTQKYKSLLPKLDKVIYDYPRKTTSKTTIATADTTEDLDFIGTAQIEALLNDIKARAIQMVAEQNPFVTDMITNSVTEATFEADPILNHLEITSPGYALTTFVCLNNVENVDKRTANESKYIVVSGDSEHRVNVRSVKESAYTIAQNMEDILQKELKSIYKKVKNKVSKDFHKEVNTAKSTIKSHTSKVVEQVTKIGGPKHAHLTHKTTTESRHNRGKKNTKALKISKEHTTATPTIDDFAMLTLYEQILAKTHEDNVMKMLATNKKRKVDETIRLSKRNPETLMDLTLTKDVKRMYDDGDNIPDIDYNNDMLPANDYASDSSTVANNSSKQVRTEPTPAEDTSYENLSDKLAYKDYVNGFKDYLKFQRDEAKQNFSALIKYQAHKHHNVDDIGKFILNKIPQIPKRKRRYFFDDSDMDDQDVSTKSDDSWFKKHFYMFLDNGPPKKYHTSETVEFKDVTEANRVEYPNAIAKPYIKGRHEKNNNLLGDVNLDELSRVLADRKRFISNLPYLNDDIISSTPKTSHIEENGFVFRVNAPKIINKFFGKRQKAPDNNESETENSGDRALKYEEDNFLFNTDLTRLQRNAVKEKSVEHESNETHTTLLNKQNAKTDKSKNNNAKVGCVSIVTQPTAIVNLHKSNSEGGKVQTLLNKLHFHKRKKNHKKKKDKRHCTRVQRFNPLKKLKNMFMSKPNERVIGTNEQTDYDMMKAHIDTFKPVKYDKLPSVDELRMQVPNITGDNIAEIANTDNEWLVKDTTRFNKISADVETSTAVNDNTLPSPRQFQYRLVKQPKPASTTRKLKNKSKINDNSFATDNIMNVNVKQLGTKEDIYTIAPTIDDLRNELDKIQMTISPHSNKEFQTNPKFKGKLESQREGDINGDNKDFDDITIKAILTRVAKYPAHKLKHNNTNNKPTGGNPKLYEFADNDNYLNVHEESLPLAVVERNTPKFEQYKKINKYGGEMRPIVEGTMKVIEEEPVSLKELVNYKKYPDYFHDLVRWNNDILGFDKVSVPTWQDILKDIQGADKFTTPNVQLIQKELSEINEHLALYNMEGKEIAIDNNPIRNGASDIETYVTSKPKYIAKVKNVKVEVGSDKNKQSYRDYDEYAKNDAKSYSNHKSQDIINVLNKLYATHNNYGKKKGHSKCKGNQGASMHKNGSNAAIVPTSKYDEMSFEDDRYIWSLNRLSKCSVKAPKSKHKESRPISKVNKMPKQFYNTPLPMKSENFRKFLKENNLDVESLTSPITNMPVVTEKWHSKMDSLSKVMNAHKINNANNIKEKSKVTASMREIGYKDFNNIDYKSDPENQIDYLNYLEQDLIDDNVRQKRFNVNYDTYTDSSLIGKEKIQDFKNKLSNLFDKKPDKESKNSGAVTDTNNDLEITIINLDDVENENKVATKPNSQELVNEATKETAKLDDLGTKAKEKESETERENTELHQTLNLLKADEKNTLDVSTTEISKDSNLQDLTMILKELPSKLPDSKHKQGDLPKRVQISSISYKYDVVYEPNKIKDREAASDEHNEIDKSTPFVAHAQNFRDNTKKKTNSEVDEVNDPKSRAARSATTTKKRSTFSQTIYLTKMKPRSRRFKIIPILMEKLKKLGRKKSSTLSMKSTLKETATSLKVDATAIETSTGTTGNYKSTKTIGRDMGLKFNYHNLFDYKLFTIDEKRNVEMENNGVSTSTTNTKASTNVDDATSKGIPSKRDVEDSNYDMAHYESGSDKTHADITIPELISSTESTNTEENTYNKSKRDVNSVYTAKDVAALEVIVDLMRNTLSYAEKSPVNNTPDLMALLRSKTGKAEKIDQTTNSIQVHIAIPYDASNKKRCLDTHKVRKVFTAKLATPVDLEYQINSVDADTATTIKPADYGLSPGTYLIVDDANIAGYAFKPVEMPLAMKKYVTEKVEETKETKMKISKEFVAAVNKYLMQLYDNITNLNEKIKGRKVRDTHWDKIKKYFGHDRVCKCKCKANKPMCSTCAACDSVIKELVFEFENIAKYMNDHCTEIQTYFWMNPSSGRALRETVHKIDKSLNDYYKRVKGKCNGRKCKTFATFIDKRDFKNKKVNRNYIGEPLLKDFKSLNDHLDFSASFIPYDAILREKGDELLDAVNNCVAKSIVKRTDSYKRKCYDKDVYTLDNISVNIICSPDTPSANTYNDKTVPITTTESENILLDYEIDKRNCKNSKSNLGGKIKPLLKNLFTYYVTQTEANTLKREAKYNQIESPLIADTGGSFWRDYLNKGNVEQNNKYKTPDLEVSVVETNAEKTPAALSEQFTFKDKLRNFRKSKTETTETTNQSVKDTSTDALAYNMNELYKLINSFKVTEDQITVTDPTITTHKTQTKHRTRKIKTKKQKKIHKTKKAKIHKHKTKTTKILKAQTNSDDTTSNNVKTSKETIELPKTESTLSYNIEETTASDKDVNGLRKESILKSTTTKMNLFNKIRKATLGFLSNIGKGQDNTSVKDEKLTNPDNIDNKKASENTIQDTTVENVEKLIDTTDVKIVSKEQTNIISGATTQMNPTILIINEDNTENVKEKSKFRSILLSLLNFESSKLDREKESLRDESEVTHDDVNLSNKDMDHRGQTIGLNVQPKKTTPELDYAMMHSIQGTEAELKANPGLLERVARKFGAAAAPMQNLMPKHERTKPRSKRFPSEETEPTKIMMLNSNGPKRDELKELNSFPTMVNPLSRNSREVIKSNDVRKTTEKSIKSRTELDSYIRNEDGIYRWRRTNDSTKRENTRRNKQNFINDRIKRERKKHKRSNAEIKNSERLSMWLHHSAGFFLATITSFYIVLATFAAVMNWVFGR